MRVSFRLSRLYSYQELWGQKFGVVSIYTSLVVTLLGITDLGLGTAAVKLISSNLDTNKHWANVLMKVIFKLEIFSGLILGVTGLIFSAQIANLAAAHTYYLRLDSVSLPAHFSYCRRIH